MKKTVVLLIVVLLTLTPAIVHAQDTQLELSGSAGVKAGKTIEIVMTYTPLTASSGIQGVLSVNPSGLTLLLMEALAPGWVAETGENGTFIVYDDTPQMDAPLLTETQLLRMTVSVPETLAAGSDLSVSVAIEDEYGNTHDASFAFTVFADDHIIRGDVNDDGLVNAQDRMILSRYLAEWNISAYPFNEQAADVNGDGAVSAIDRAILSRYLAHWGEPYSLYFE